MMSLINDDLSLVTASAEISKVLINDLTNRSQLWGFFINEQLYQFREEMHQKTVQIYKCRGN
jgi:hypothetical protein